MKTPYIILRNINHQILDQKYNFHEYQEKNKQELMGVNNDLQTKLIDLKETITNFSYIDEAKSDHVCLLTMHDVLSQKKLAAKTNLQCFHCHHSFTNIPLGCPIEFKNSKIYKNYYSEITKSNYILQESILESKTNHKNQNSSYFQTEVQPLNYYVTDGIFCSFNCCKAFILSNKNNPLYEQSEFLLNQIYQSLFAIEGNFDIKPAPHWKLLEAYGGFLSIEEFRNNFYKIEYTNKNDYMTEIPTFRSIGHVFEKKLKL